MIHGEGDVVGGVNVRERLLDVHVSEGSAERNDETPATQIDR
jgi:hypothetical protein